MATWAEFESAAPEVAAEGRRLIHRGDVGEMLLATVRGDEPPRIHPINVAIVGGRLCAFILRSAKRTDLDRDGRYALHTHQDPAAPSEFAVRGHASLVESHVDRSAAAAQWSFEVDDTYSLFEFSIETALLAPGTPLTTGPRATRPGRTPRPARRAAHRHELAKRSDFDTGHLTVSSGTVSIVGLLADRQPSDPPHPQREMSRHDQTSPAGAAA